MYGWIDCKEQMPQINQKVMFYTPGSDPHCGMFNGQLWLQDIYWCRAEDDGWIDNAIDRKIVTHWRHMPRNPSGGRDDV